MSIYSDLFHRGNRLEKQMMGVQHETNKDLSRTELANLELTDEELKMVMEYATFIKSKT